MKYLFVINPISGGKDKSNVINIIEKEFENYALFYTDKRFNPERLTSKIKLLQPENIIAVGGDGTILYCTQAMLALTKKPKLGLIPLGSANGLSTELNIPFDLEEAVSILLNPSKYLNIDIVQVNKNHFCLHIGDAGLNARIVRDYENDDNRGYLTYAKYFFEELALSESFKITIKADGEIHHEEGYMVAIANAQQYGNGVKLTHDSKLDDGLFELVVLKNINASTFIKAGLTALNLNLDQEDNIKIIPCKEVEVTFNQTVPFQLDGEYLGKVSSFKAKIIQNAIPMIIG